ncbi:universal stress protein [Fodinicola acaciae]|uniref:universal stress protein n=1 Tax=Fodinicola acaciae TaxID=2681555 RepID=UPI001C9E2A1B|nr:universal stress protein [Fodinicola acaciae]
MKNTCRVAVRAIPAVGENSARLLPTTAAFPYRDWRAATQAERDTIAGRPEPWRVSFPGIEVTEQLVEEFAVPALLEASRTARLLVSGSRGRGGLAGPVPGSVSHTRKREASCSAAVVPTHLRRHR